MVIFTSADQLGGSTVDSLTFNTEKVFLYIVLEIDPCVLSGVSFMSHCHLWNEYSMQLIM